MSVAYTQEDIDDIENNLLEAEANIQTYVDSNVQTFRTNAMYRMNPWLSGEPETVMAMAASNMDTNILLNNTAVAYGMYRANTLADDLRNKMPSTQRAIYSALTPAQQENLAKMGYKVPTSNGMTKNWYEGPLGSVTAPFRWSISDVAIPVGSAALKTFTFLQDQIYQRPIRTIAQLSTGSKVASILGGGAAGYAGFAGAVALGVANPLALAAVAGTAAVVGATATAFLTETIQGNPSRFVNAFIRAGDGEKLFTIEAQNRARELLGDEALNSLAQTFASKLGNQTDLVALLKEMAGSRDALNPEKQFDKIQEIAGEIVEPNTQAYFETVAALETIIQQPIFQEAIVTLQQGKISLGRVAARGLGLNPNSGAYQFISGFVDGAYMVAVDPLMLLGTVTKGVKAFRYGMEYADGAVMANKFIAMYEKHESVKRVFDQLAKGVVNGDVRVIKRYAAQWMPLYDNLRTYYNLVKETSDFVEFTGRNLVEFISDGQRFGAIMQGIGITQGVTRQTLKTLGPTQYALKTATGALGDFLRGAGDASVYRIIEKISGNANFMDELLSFLPETMREDFLALTQNSFYKTGLELAQTPIVGRLLQPFGAFKEALVTPALTKQVVNIMNKPQAVQDITEFVRSFQKIGLSSYMQDLWIKAIIDNPDFDGRINAIASLVDSLATAGNMRQFPDAAETLDKIIFNFKQHYAFGSAGTMSTKNGLMKMAKVGSLPVLHNQAIMIALPDMKLLRKAAADGSYLRVLLGIPENQYIKAFQEKIWKPSVLFRLGFAFRNSGEDLLALFARAGSGFWLQEFGARNVGNYDAYQEANKVQELFNKVGVNVGTVPKLTERQKWILMKDYDIPAHIRPFARILTRLGSGKNPTFVVGKNYGKWLSTFLRGENRQQSSLVELMKFLRGGTESAASNTLRENLSLSPNIIKNNLKSMADMMIYGNEYSFRRMIVGGVNKNIVSRAQYFTTDAFNGLMDRLGTGSGIPLDLNAARSGAVERQLGDKINVRLRNGEMGVVRQGETHRLLEDYHVSVHERTSELSDDGIISPVIQRGLKAFTPDIQEIVSPPEFKRIIDAWKKYLRTDAEELGSIDASIIHLWLVINEPLEHPARVQRYNAALKQHNGGALHETLKNNFGGLKVPTPEEFMKILLQSDPEKVNAVGANALMELHKLVGDIPEPAKTWVMGNIYQDWATDGQHFNPEVMRWNGQSVGRSKGQPIYRAMQRPGEQYVINPDGSLTMFFQDQAHWEDAEALSMSLSYEQVEKYLGGIFTQGQPMSRDVIFTSTVDDVFAAHGITKEDLTWRDYRMMVAGFDVTTGLPIKYPGKGAGFVQGPEGPYQLQQFENWTYNAQNGRRELALHAEKPEDYLNLKKTIEELEKLKLKKPELESLLQQRAAALDEKNASASLDNTGSPDPADRVDDQYLYNEPRLLYNETLQDLALVEEKIANAETIIKNAGLDLANPIPNAPPRNSITIPAGSYTLSYPTETDNWMEGTTALLDELITGSRDAITPIVKKMIDDPRIIEELNQYFYAAIQFSGSRASQEYLKKLLEIKFSPEGNVVLLFDNTILNGADRSRPDQITDIWRVASQREGMQYALPPIRTYTDPKYPLSADRLGFAQDNIEQIELPVEYFAELFRDMPKYLDMYSSTGWVENTGVSLDALNNSRSVLPHLEKMDSYRTTKLYENNEFDSLGEASSRVAHLLPEDKLREIENTLQFERGQLSIYKRSPGENAENIERSQKIVDRFELQLQMHNDVLEGRIKPGEIFADYSTSPFYSSFDELQPELEMEMARIIESGEFDDVINLNRRKVDTGPTQEVFVIDLSNLPPYIKGVGPELGGSEGGQKLLDFDTSKPAFKTEVEGDLDASVEVPYGAFSEETTYPTITNRNFRLNDGPNTVRSEVLPNAALLPKNIRELMYQAIETRSPLVFTTEEAANFYLRQMNELLEQLVPYKPKGSVARNLEQKYFIPEVKPMYLPVRTPEELAQPQLVSKQNPETGVWFSQDENQLFAGSSKTSSIPFARKRYSTPSRADVQRIVGDPTFVDTPVEAFDVIGWPVDNYPVVSEYLYDAATQGSQKQIIDAASETIKQRVKSGRRVDYVVSKDDQLWILNEGRPMLLKQGDVIPSRNIYKDPRMGEEDLVDLGDLRYMDETPITYAGETDINWNIIAPLLYDQAEKLSGRKLYEGTQSTRLSGMDKEVYLDHVPVTRFGLYDVQNSSLGNLPNIEIASVLEDIPTGMMPSFDKVVQIGFNKVLAPVMDAISRKPMAFHAYNIAMEQNLKNINWMLFDTPEEIALNNLADLFHSKSIFGPQSPQTLETWSNVGRQVGISHGVPEAQYWSNGESIAYIRSFVDDEFDTALNILKNNPVDNKSNALVNFAKKNKGNVITGDREIGGSWDFLDYVISQLGEDVIRTAGADWAMSQRIREIQTVGIEGVNEARVRSLLDNLMPEDWATLKSAWNTREKALENARYYAQERTIRDVMPYIDSNEIRSQFADWGRGFMPFFYAEENFIKRWARILALDSGTNGLATLRKFQLQYTGLREMGVIRQQPNGDDYFVIPGTDLMIDMLSNVSGLELGLTGMLTQSTTKILPGFGPRFGAPSYSPLVLWPVSFIAGIFSDFEPVQALERNIVGEDNKLDRNWWDHFLPASMVNTVKAVKLMASSPEELRKDEKLGNYLNTAMAHLMAQGKGPRPNMTASEQEEVMRDLMNYARILEVTRLLGGWVTMGPAGVEINTGADNTIKWLTGGTIENAAQVLDAEYYESIRLYGIDDGTVRYINTYIDQGKRFGVQNLFNPMMYTTSPNETLSGAVIPSTKEAIQYYLDNKNIFGEYKLGSPWMIPSDPETDNDFSQWAWNQSVVEGLRYRNTAQEILDEFMFKEGATVYFSKQNEYEEKALIAEQSGDQASADIWREKWERFSKGWEASHPKFNEVLTSNTRASERKNIINEIQIMLKDPEFPSTDYSNSMKILVDGWNLYMNTVGEMSLNKTASGRSAVATERFNWQDWVENDFLIKYPQLKSFWLGILKPESGLS